MLKLLITKLTKPNRVKQVITKLTKQNQKLQPISVAISTAENHGKTATTENHEGDFLSHISNGIMLLFLCRNLGTPHKQLQHLRCDLCSWSGCQCGFEAKATLGDHVQSRRFAKPPQFENFPQPSNADSLPNNCMLIKVKEARTRIRNNPI